MEPLSNSHHLVLGSLTDFLSGEILADTLDERYLQKIARILVHDCGFDKTEIRSRVRVRVQADDKIAVLKIDFIVYQEDKACIMIKYAPGSLVTRRLSSVSLSRIVEPYQIPIVIITNGEDAEIIEGSTGKISGTGLKNIPDRTKLKNFQTQFNFPLIKQKTYDQASRIAYACEADGSCPCDTDIKILG